MARFPDQHAAPAEIMSTIDEFIRRELLQISNIKLTEDTPLIEDGYITSLQAVDLVLFLEQRFQIEIPPEQVTEEEFKNLRTLTDLVRGKLAEVS